MLLARVAMGSVVWRRFGRHAKAFAGPRAEVYLFAALTAKRAVHVRGAVHAIAAAAGAGDDARLRGGGRGVGHPGVILLLKSAGLIFCGPRRDAVSGLGLGLGLSKAYAHKVSSNAASSLQACKRPSASSRMSRTETIKRLPLISGIRFSAGSMRSRSSWNVRPWGRFC